MQQQQNVTVEELFVYDDETAYREMLREEVSELGTRRDDTWNFSPLKPEKGDKRLSFSPFSAQIGSAFPTLSEFSLSCSEF